MQALKEIAEKYSTVSSSKLSAEEACKLICERRNREKEEDKDGYECEACGNKEYVFEPRYNESYGTWQDTAVPCKCQKVRRVLRRLKKSGLQDAINKNFKSYEADTEWRQKLKEMVMRWVQEGNGRWLYIGGAPGSGKTHLCVAAMLKLLKQGREVYYMLWREDVPKLKSLVTEHEEYGRMISELKNVDVLYIDDMFKTGRTESGAKQRPTGADINIAFEIINHRYVTNKLTVFTSECGMSELIDIDQALAGRIVEKAGEYCVSLKGKEKDWRLKGGITL